MAKGLTRWHPRSTPPVRRGLYECAIQVSRSMPLILWTLEWDGTGFLVPISMIVVRWRGLTKKAAARAALEAQGGGE